MRNFSSISIFPLQVVNSKSGLGPKLRNALWHTGDTRNEAKLLWHDKLFRGWKDRVAYRWFLQHRPLSGLIRLITCLSDIKFLIPTKHLE